MYFTFCLLSLFVFDKKPIAVHNIEMFVNRWNAAAGTTLIFRHFHLMDGVDVWSQYWTFAALLTLLYTAIAQGQLTFHSNATVLKFLVIVKLSYSSSIVIILLYITAIRYYTNVHTIIASPKGEFVIWMVEKKAAVSLSVSLSDR